ncbi:MAG TPA: phosphoribosylformylglycinamidine synthase subunit PurL [Actinomycetales bacterium]|nr:phosphoribosylformylglycinamidine synthase subunit PurL [Actinomycetales bacterium]
MTSAPGNGHNSSNTLDTVENAAATPDEAQEWAELGLQQNEYEEIRTLLGRRPTAAELAMYSVMWAEHCSYKSSKRHLKQFGEKTTEAMRSHQLVGIGQNAGVVDVGDGWAVTFKIESHNSPSYIEPFQGAATGIGGIVRDIISMGARPVAVMDQLRVGEINHPDTARVLKGAVSGLSHYGNTLGVANIGGELVFDSAYQNNPLVNALALGVLRHEDIHLANATGAGNKVVLFGARTGGDGIGGASVLSSQSFADGEPAARPNVQAGDPYLEKLIIECCLELFEANLVEGIQDLGAAGISCATSELASNGDSGMHIDLETVPLRDPDLNAGEILMSESQERMMAIVAPDKLGAFLAITKKWGVEAAVIGELNDSQRLTIDWSGQRIVDVDPHTVAEDSPVYDRPFARPAWQDALQADRAEDLPRPQTPEEISDQILRLVGAPNQADKSWVTRQFDRYAQGNTAQAMPDDAGVVRISKDAATGVAIATDASGRFTKLDPRTGAQQALVEAYRNVAATGARPIAVSDCLNFGSPEDPDAMWQLVEAITGLADACMELEIPVTGGNVSLYNSTGEPGQIDSSIHPTPVVGVLGVLDDVSRAVTSGWRTTGLNLYLLGTTKTELSGTAWAHAVHNHLGGLPPQVDLDAERRLAQILVNAARDGLVDGAHDLSDGGLIQALVEGSLRFGVGAEIDLDGLLERDGIDLATALFSESGARAVVAVPPGEEVRFLDLCAARKFPALKLGTTQEPISDDAPTLAVSGLAPISLQSLRESHESTLPRHFG